jgi:Flp pilus assembly protein TadG
MLKRRCQGRGPGQSLAEFAIVLPVLVAILGGTIQFGLIFWAQNTLTQVVRDTGRWASTQQYGGSQTSTNNCSTAANVTGVIAEANAVASSSSLIGYSPSSAWTSSNVTVTWSDAAGSSAPSTDACPPPDNTQVWFVTITISHTVPTFFPGMQYLPVLGKNGQVVLSSSATFRMEPAP